MRIECKKDADTLTVILCGDLDTNTAPVLMSTLEENLEGIASLVLDLTGVNYLSSAGIRTILRAESSMKTVSGSLKIVGVQPAVYKVFEITMLIDILDITQA